MKARVAFCLMGLLIISGCAGENGKDNRADAAAQTARAGASGAAAQAGEGAAGAGVSAGSGGMNDQAGASGGSSPTGKGAKGGQGGSKAGAGAGEGGVVVSGQSGTVGPSAAGSGGTAGEPTETPSVDASDPLYGRYEAPSSDNFCKGDGDCMTSGCNGEVCAAESVITTCDVVALPAGNCGCVDSECIWHKSGGPSPVDKCGADRGCVVYSDYCEGCNCLAVPAGKSPAHCTGNIVSCFVDPCLDRTAACVDDRCVLK